MAVDYTDHTIKTMMDSMHARVKNPGGVKSHGFHDHAKPPLDYGPGTPAKIKGVKESHKRLNIDGTPKK